MPLQIAQVQVSTELLEVSGMDSKDSFPKTGLSDNFNLLKLNAFTFPKERLI